LFHQLRDKYDFSTANVDINLFYFMLWLLSDKYLNLLINIMFFQIFIFKSTRLANRLFASFFSKFFSNSLIPVILHCA